MAPVEERPAPAEVAAERVGGATPQRDDPFLAALADRAHEPLLEVDAAALEPDGLAHAEPGAVQQLDERSVAQVARGRARGGLDQALGLARRERSRQAAGALGRGDVRSRILLGGSDQHAMAEERARRGEPAGDRRGGKALSAELGEVALELLASRRGRRMAKPGAQGAEVAPVGLDRPRRQPRSRDGEERLDLQDRGWALS